jgi:heme exporter protein A
MFDVVEAEGLTKLFGRQRALAGVSTRFQAGSVAALLGPNGAGKSTLLGILSTLVRPTSGQVTFGGARPGPAVRAAIGVLAHEPMVYAELTGRENLIFFARLYDLGDADARARRLLAEVGLASEAAERPARTYSRGMLQRLALARALLHAPRLLLLDEPFTGLDAGGTRRLAETIDAARKGGNIVVVVTHEVAPLDGLCDHLVVLNRGKIVRDERAASPLGAQTLREAAAAVAAG